MILGKLLEETYRALGFVKLQSVATGGTATTIVDTSLATLYGTNAFRKHIAFISKTTDGASPQGKYGILPAAHYVASTQTFTIPTVTDAVGAGDIYTIVSQTQIPLYEMLAEINNALAMLPPVRLVNTSLTTTADTLEYTLPAATKNYDIQDVRIGNATDGYLSYTGYYVRPASGGSTEKLVFLSQPEYDTATPANCTIELTYLGKQTLSVYSDTVSEKYPDELVYAICAYKALTYYMNKKGLYNNKRWVGLLSVAKDRYERAQFTNPVRTPAARLRRTELGRL